MNLRFLILLFLPLPSLLAAQPVLVTKNFLFREGIYLNFQSFRSDAPDFTWEQVQVMRYTNPQTFITQVESIQPAGLEAISPDSIWGFCIQGIPYIRLSRDWIRKELATFAPLQLRGKICFFEFNRKDTSDVLITAYNPANGQPFRKGVIRKAYDVNTPKMLDFETGAVVDFNRENLVAWIGDDPELAEAVMALREEELKTKLFKSLLIYVDRNNVYIH